MTSRTTHAGTIGVATSHPGRADETSVYRKVTWRLVPFLMLCYVAAYLDRVNVGFAKLQMLNDLKFSETVYGLGAGVFFLGYFLFEVPSNIILHRVGARVWIARIMITWAVISGAFMFVRSAEMFYIMRFLLGVAEAGFFPGIILYLTYWYPAERRARIIATFMTAIPLSGVIGGPLSGWLMESFAGVNGWAGWQWLFMVEAIPAAVLGIAVLLYLDNGIRSAKWLTEDEKRILEEKIAHEGASKVVHPSIRAVFADRRVWLMALIYFCCVMGQYGLTFWMPTLIKAAGIKGVFNIGLFTAIPYAAAVAAMILFGRSADRHGERRWHVAIPLLMGAAGLVGSVLSGTSTGLAVAFLSLAAAGVLTSAPLFWSLPTAFLGGVSAACGIAAINSVGNLAGFVSPYMIGWLKDLTHSTNVGMYMLAAVLIGGAVAVLAVPARLVNR
jgi:D-galactonate transporter